MVHTLASKTLEFLRSWPNRIFLAIVLLFIGEAGYLAVMNSFPMAYDESYHFGLIQFYSQHLNPFVSTQAPNTYVYGNIVDNPSWLYHYLLSFPYRLLELTGSLRIEVTGLRMFSVAFVAASLCVLYAITKQLRVPAWLGVIIVALFSLTPVVTVLASQMNYDNLIILITLACTAVLLTLFAKARTSALSPVALLTMISLVSLGSLVKFSFLPLALAFALATIAIVAYSFIRFRSQLWAQIITQLRTTNRWLLASLAAVTVAIVALCIGFYAQNIAQYKTPVPDCSQVLSVEACMSYSPWSRNYQLEQTYQSQAVKSTPDTMLYIKSWALTMTTQLFGNIAPDGGYSYADKRLLLVVLSAVLVTGALTMFSFVRVLRTYPQLAIVVGIAAVYMAALFLRNYTEFLRFGTPTAIQGRYFVPVLAVVYLVIGIGTYTWLTTRKRAYHAMQFGLTSLVVGSMVVFGGAMSYASGVLPDFHWQYGPAQNALVNTNLATTTTRAER